MTSTLLRRQLARTSHRLASTSALPSLAARRAISSTTVRRYANPVDDVDQAPKTASGRKVIDTHIAEDLQGMHAADILAETGSRPEAQMRHFTGTLYFLASAVLSADRHYYSQLWVSY
jgi:NADH dehydrogenase (ubiquinone) Fe-S protein 2